MNYLSTGAEDFVHRCTRDAVQVSLASVDAVIEEAAGQQIGERKCCCFISNVCVCVFVCFFSFLGGKTRLTQEDAGAEGVCGIEIVELVVQSAMILPDHVRFRRWSRVLKCLWRPWWTLWVIS